MASPKDRLFWFLLLVWAGTLAESALIDKPSCTRDTWFRHRRYYVYHYAATVEAGFSGTSDVVTGSRLSCVVTLNVPRRCEMTMQLSGCILKERGLDGKMAVSSKSKELAKLLHMHEVYLQMNEGLVLGERVVAEDSEAEYILNIKRAIISQLQLPILQSWKAYNESITVHDQFGDCPTTVTLNGASRSLWTRRDISQCSLPQVFGRHRSMLSFVRQFQLQFLQRPINEILYPFESEVECQYEIKNSRIGSATCLHDQTFKPITYDGELTAATAVNVTQSLVLRQSRKISKKASQLNRSLKGRKYVGLMMKLEVPSPQEVTSSRLFTTLDELILAVLASEAEGENKAPEQFQSLVALARDAGPEVLAKAQSGILACREPGGCALPAVLGGLEAAALQKQRETFFSDAMLSCGTEACVISYLKGVQQGAVVNFLEAELSLLNMALFYHPTPSVLKNTLELCLTSRKVSRNNCWLTLGSLTGRLALDLGSGSPDHQNLDPAPAFSDNVRQEGEKVIGEVLTSLMKMMGDTCHLESSASASPGQEQQEKLASLLLGLKSLANAGAALSMAESGQVRDSVLQCLNNSQLPDSVSAAAVTVLSKVDVDSVVLTALTSLLQDSDRPVALRAMAFDRLVRHPDVSTIRQLADVIQTEKLSTLKTYMTTRVGHLVESNVPDGYSLRTLWLSVLESKPLPVLEELKGRGSEYGEFSRYVELPLSRHQLGGKLAVKVVFDPASLVPSQLRVSLSFLLFNNSVQLLDFGVDMQGFENIVRVLMSKGLNSKEGMVTVIARVVEAMYPKMGEPPTMFFHDPKVVEGLKELFKRVNMPSGDSTQAHAHVKVLGSEVGYISLQDIMKIVQGQALMGGGPSAAAGKTPLQRLAEGLEVYVGKSCRVLEVVRMFPTVAGLPWRANVQSTMVASSTLHLLGDVVKFLTDKGPLEVSGNLSASVAVQVTCEESVAIGDLTSSGVRLNGSVLVRGAVDGRARFEPGPGSGLLQFGLGAVKRPLTLVRARSDIYQLHNGEEKEILTPRTQVKVDKCVPNFLQTWSGHNVCVKGFYQHVAFVPGNPVPFVSGPVHLDVTGQAVDKSMKEFIATFSMKRQPSKEDPSKHVIVLGANFSAPGKKLQRNLDTMLQVNPETKALQGRVQVPEFGLRYALDLHCTHGNKKDSNSRHHLVSSVLTLGPRVLHSVILESQNKDTAPSPPGGGPAASPSHKLSSAMLLKLNMSLPGLSLEVLANTSSGQKPGLFTQGVYIRYFCEPHLGILYALHGQPKLAAASGHTSLWSFNNLATMRGRSLADTWRASDTMSILAPGHNITLKNHITANYTWASRAMTIHWISGLGTPNVTTDVIVMDAEVRNNSVERQQDLRYVMQLDHKDKYVLTLDGSLKGPLSNMAFQVNTVYTAKAKKRQRRSLRSITNRLKRIEEEVEEAVETIEQTVVRRGAELTEMFLQWMAQEPTPKKPGEKPQKGADARGVAAGPKEPGAGLAAGGPISLLKPGALLSLFRGPSWKMNIDANLKFKPKMVAGAPKPVGFDVDWDMHVRFPDLKKELFFFNGTLNRMQRYDVDTDWRLHSQVLNFTLTYFMQQQVDYPRVYHWHRWNLEEFTKHRFDRSFSFLVDLQRQDHLVYHVRLVSPRTNLTHEIAFNIVSPQLRTLRSNMSLHCESPLFDIKYTDKSDVTAKGMTTDISLNSTWLNLTLDSDVDWSAPQALLVTQRLDTFGMVPFLQGPSRVDVSLKMDMRKARQKPTLTIRHNTTRGRVNSVVGQLLNKDLVFFTFTTQAAGAKSVTPVLKWRIHLIEPTRLYHSLSWEKPMTEPMFSYLYNAYRAGSHSFLLFGETVADNVYKNVSDMVVPFTKLTISQVVDRVVQGRMKKVAMAGLDPREHVPIMVKVLKGGLKVVQALQLSWQNSEMGRLSYSLGAHRAVSTAAWLSTRLHSMLVHDPPFPLKQYVKFHMLPAITAAAQAGQFHFTVPLPFVATSRNYLVRPQPRLLARQRQRCLEEMDSWAHKQLPFLAVLARDKIQTFDGLNYDFTLPGKTNCTYLLGTDLVVKNQSLLLEAGSAVMAMRQASVSLRWNGTVSINQTNRQAVSQLPAELSADQATVTLSNGQLVVGVKDQMRMTYDPESELYVIEMARHLHNRSVGLLGTTTREAGDDLLMPSGQVKASPVGFQDKYELSGQAACKKHGEVNAAVSSVACADRHAQMCTELFQDARSSPLASCFPDVDPQPFLLLCLQRTCQVMPHNPSRACPVVSTYVRLCASRGQEVKADTPAFQQACRDEGCSKGRRRSRRDAAMDVVLCPALHSSDRSPEDVRKVLGNLARYLTPSTRLGLVHGAGRHVHAHLFDDQLFVSAEKLQKHLKSSKQRGEDGGGDEEEGNVPALEDILQTAASYPFSPNARRFVVLLTGPHSPEVQNLAYLKQKLWDNDISLIQVSADLDFARVLSASWDGSVVCRGCSKGSVSIATTSVGKLAAQTRGMYMSFDVLKKGRRGKMQKLIRPLEHILYQASPLCASVVEGD